MVSEDGTIGLATVQLDDQTGFVPSDDKKAIIDTAQGHETDDLRVELTGDAVREVAYRDYTVHYCATCQTGGRVLADNTTSKFLR